MPNNRILQVDCSRVVQAFQPNQDYQQVATMLGISWQTALNIVRRFQQREYANVLPGVDEEM